MCVCVSVCVCVHAHISICAICLCVLLGVGMVWSELIWMSSVCVCVFDLHEMMGGQHSMVYDERDRNDDSWV